MDIWVLFSIISKFVLYVSTLFAAGTLFYTLLFETEKAKPIFNYRMVVLVFAVLGMLTSLLGYALKAASLTGDAASMIDLDMLGILWETPVGTAFLLRFVGFSLFLISHLMGSLGKGLGMIASLLVLSSFTQIGHVTNLDSGMFQIVLLLHIVGISLWVGIFLPLIAMCKDAEHIATTSQIAGRFGNIALGFVPILLMAGGWLAFALVGSVENLLFTHYGQILIAKIVLVVGVLGLAATNKLRFVRSLCRGEVVALKHLRLSIRLELILILFVLMLTAILTSTVAVPETQ